MQKTGIYNRITGRDGVDLEDTYQDGIRTLLGIHTQGFPNLFIMGGYQASFQFNLTDMLQTQGDHIAACIDYVRRTATHRPTFEAEEWWVNEVISHRGKTRRNQECTPGYYNFEGESQRVRTATTTAASSNISNTRARSRADAGELRVRLSAPCRSKERLRDG